MAAAQQEQQARAATYGVLEPMLYDVLQRNAADRIPVAIWVAMEDPAPLARGEQADLNTLAARVQASQNPVADAIRAVKAASPDAPLGPDSVRQADLVPVIFTA